jgi:hypothetical protein
MFIIHLQNQRIRKQETEMRSLSEWNRTAAIEIKELHDRVKPLEQLGIFKNGAPRKSP